MAGGNAINRPRPVRVKYHYFGNICVQKSPFKSHPTNPHLCNSNLIGTMGYFFVFQSLRRNLTRLGRVKKAQKKKEKGRGTKRAVVDELTPIAIHKKRR